MSYTCSDNPQLEESEAERDAREISKLMKQDKHQLATMVHVQRFELNLTHDEITRLKERLEELKRENEAKDAIIKAVAHIGIDWGYGSYELESKFIDQARALYEKNEKRQDPSLQPTLESRL